VKRSGGIASGAEVRATTTTSLAPNGAKYKDNRARAQRDLEQLKSLQTGDDTCPFASAVWAFEAQARLLAESEDACRNATTLHTQAAADLQQVQSRFTTPALNFSTVNEALSAHRQEQTALEEVKDQWASLQANSDRFSKLVQHRNLGNIFTIQMSADEASTRQREVELEAQTEELEHIAADCKDKEEKLHWAQQDLADADARLAVIKDKLKLVCAMYGSNGPTPTLPGITPRDKLALLDDVFRPPTPWNP
jgi:DNA repair exonuclease SbcCD ATPase subunit